MADEKRISVSFGAFAVDIEGYDDPFAVLSTVISHIKSSSGTQLGEKAFAASDLENAELLASLSSGAATLELTDDAEKPRLLVTAPTAEANVPVTPVAVAAPTPAASEVPAEPAAALPTAETVADDALVAEESKATAAAEPEHETQDAEQLQIVEDETKQTEAPADLAPVQTAEPSETPEPEPVATAATEPKDVVKPDTAPEVPTTTSSETIEAPEAESVEAADATPNETSKGEPTEPAEPAEPEPVSAEDVEPAKAAVPAEQVDDDVDGDEEAAILRRVRRAITSLDDDDAPEAPKPKAKPIAAARSPEEQKADVVKDIATTLRRIGAQADEEIVAPADNEQEVAADKTAEDIAEPKSAAAAARSEPASPPEAITPATPKITPLSTTISDSSTRKPKIRDGATGQLKPKARKPLTMQMQIRPKAAEGAAKPIDRRGAAKAQPLGAKEQRKPLTRSPLAAAPEDDAPTPAEGAAALRQTYDREKIRERLNDLAKDDEVIDNFLFDDVETIGVATAAETTAPSDVSAPGIDDIETEEEPLILTAAEAAPLTLEDPIAEPLMLTDPIEPPEAVPPAPEPAPEPEPEPVEIAPLELTEVAEPVAEAAATVKAVNEPVEPVEEPAEAPAASVKPKKGEVEASAGFVRLQEVRDTPVPMMREPSTRPKRRNGGPRLVALSDETQFDESMSPQDFAAHIGASSLHDMLEATAVYMAIVEGRANFSRQDIMQAFARIETAGNYSTEQRLKTFRKLLASGALTRVDERDYALSHDTRFGYEAQLQA